MTPLTSSPKIKIYESALKHIPIKKLILALLWCSAYLLTTLFYSETKLYSHYGKFEFSLFSALFSMSKPNFSVIGLINDLLIFHLIAIAFYREKTLDLQESRIFQGFTAIGKIIGVQFRQISQSEMNSLLLLLIKAYYLPMMTGYVLGNFSSMSDNFYKLTEIDFGNFSFSTYNQNLLPAIFFGLIMIDTACFVVGYATESKKLGNVVKSVDKNLLSWAATLICYYPLVKFSPIQYFGWHSSEFSTFESPLLCAIANTISIWLFLIYTWSSLALGFKASNLTSRGVVCKGPYSYVRHPAYSSKCLSWWVMSLPFFAREWQETLGCMLSITAIYVVRAIFEERHLGATDPDYTIYRKKVSYRFIPGLI